MATPVAVWTKAIPETLATAGTPAVGTTVSPVMPAKAETMTTAKAHGMPRAALKWPQRSQQQQQKKQEHYDPATAGMLPAVQTSGISTFPSNFALWGSLK